jgi:4-alpha-glucanotransferase
LLISLDKLCEEGLLSKQDLTLQIPFDDNKVDYGNVITFKNALYRKAFDAFVENREFKTFCTKHAVWLNDYALFMSLKNRFDGHPWSEWEKDIKLRKPAAMEKYTHELEREIKFYKFLQYYFFKQWHELKAYANKNKIKIIGDIPIYVAFDSSDAWSAPSAFYFDKNMNPIKVAGVPPDYFSKTGQLWGNPLYNWKALKEDGFKWWIERVKATEELVDIIRIDHFRGFAGYWAVPYGDKTAAGGKWEKGPGEGVFVAIKKTLGDLPILAEDLGFITPDVHALRDKFGFPSMKIIQFGFDSKEGSPYIPHLFDRNNVAYTGTHDNDTIVGWFQKANPQDRQFVLDYTNSDGHDIAWDFIRITWASVAVIALIPLQDALSLGSEARMNTPSVASGNWQWRFRWEQITPEIKQRLKKLTEVY